MTTRLLSLSAMVLPFGMCTAQTVILPPEAPRPAPRGDTLKVSMWVPPPPCSSDTARVDGVCVDLYEAPNERGVNPLVMQTAEESEAWCAEKGKRLCTEEEWTHACEGPQGLSYGYGSSYESDRCNTARKFLGRDENRLNTWPGLSAQREVDRIWQGEPSGNRPACASSYGVYDMLGNIEEWTRRKWPYGEFRHVLKGRYWAGGQWTCRRGVYNHGDHMRYYETGFRCCSDVVQPTLTAEN